MDAAEGLEQLFAAHSAVPALAVLQLLRKDLSQQQAQILFKNDRHCLQMGTCSFGRRGRAAYALRTGTEVQLSGWISANKASRSAAQPPEYAKQAGLRLWMGPWSYVELEAARGIMFSSVSKAKLSELYARWGGIPRYVLKYAANPELQEELDAAVATVNMDLLWKSVGNIEAAPDVSHKLIHVEVDENCSRKRLVFGSGIIGQRVMQELHRQGTAELAKFVKWSAGRPDLASLRGIMFQGLAHDLLCRGGSFRMRSLSNPGEQEVSLEVPEMELMEVQDSDLKKISPTTKGSGLLVPVARNFTAVDSFLILPDSNGKAARLLLIQVTVSANHRISASGLQTSMRKLSRDLKGLKREMYFAVPPDLFKQFRKQQFEGVAKDSIEIDQFAIEIPLPWKLQQQQQQQQLSDCWQRWPCCAVCFEQVPNGHLNSEAQPSATVESAHGHPSQAAYLEHLLCCPQLAVMVSPLQLWQLHPLVMAGMVAAVDVGTRL
ncbi:hypothetical protein VOLCADRAFT_108572 [Volvox carteri f. nagariensis]|uniref:Uncharacterized protein n=1 Tax=Volvox carteri f. nagariensis TaxID=3068 RepID=D8UL15_VOLCA|nr:uncharacterized protein VOLCADRAFT_108572 [Volvox carteri f. nagariensis]EFJ39587.1 hypothetical protein VOLCADRAFT_108572 [Volvox carteri f. nagariensis]|eukprot:XP_002959351.1 hypothetical protein VOLCADRAFT_108572 [Volvox carteri f. nagariensis]